MIHRTVDVVYDPADISEVTVECEGLPASKAKPLVITSHAAPRPKLPERYEKTEPARSRLLDAAEKNHTRRQETHRTAVSFTGINTLAGGGSNV